MATKRLTWDDMVSNEAGRKERESYTEEDARKLGYPSLQVLHLSDELRGLVGKWRDTKDDNLIAKYHALLLQMILKGYDVTTLPIQDQLPPDLMPELPPPAVQMAIQNVYQLTE